MADISTQIEAAVFTAQTTDGAPLAPRQRLQLLLAVGFVLVLLEFAAPSAGLIGLPITFFLKNRLHLPAQGLATFNLWASIPLYVSFVFGFLRDRWNPFGAGDRGYLTGFGLIAAGLFVVLAFVPPSYPTLLVGVILVSTASLIAGSAARSLGAMIGQDNAATGQAGAIANLAALLPALVAFALGGALSQALEGHGAATAARILFLTGGALMAGVAVFGLVGPRRLFALRAPPTAERLSALGDAGRLLRHWPIYPALAIYALWQFAPAGGAALQYHLANTLHATDTQVGIWYALFAAGFVPVIAGYPWLCRRLKLSALLWIGALMAVPQFLPFLFIHNVNQALVAAVVMALMGGVGQAAFTDLAIRSCPEGLQGTMMMFLITMYWVPARFGDLWGAYLYDRAGGFRTAILATVAVYALILPILLLVPRRLTNTVDGQVTA